MCISDWRIGRLLKRQITAFSIAAGTGLDYPVNLQRAGIMIAVSQSSGTSNDRVNVAIDGIAYITLGTSGSRIEHFINTHGEMPSRHYVLSASTAACLGAVIELIAPEELLNMPLEEYLRAYKSWHPSS